MIKSSAEYRSDQLNRGYYPAYYDYRYQDSSRHTLLTLSTAAPRQWRPVAAGHVLMRLVNGRLPSG